MFIFFFLNDTATTEIYTLSLHDALPIYVHPLPEYPDPARTDPPAPGPLRNAPRPDLCARGLRDPDHDADLPELLRPSSRRTHRSRHRGWGGAGGGFPAGHRAPVAAPPGRLGDLA